MPFTHVSASIAISDGSIAFRFLVLFFSGRIEADATRVIHDPESDTPLIYLDRDGNQVESEFVQPPDELHKDLRKTLFLDAYDGHPLIRPIRRLLRERAQDNPRMKLKVPDFQLETTTIWLMDVGENSTTIAMIDQEPYSPPPTIR